jgi:NADPH:quinone reductase-like Zn-dependent oxidoreductase
MKAIVYTQYGSPDVLSLQEVAKPTPKDNEVLIRVHAAATNAYDWHIMRADPFLARLNRGLFKPKNNIPGADLAGVVEAVGKDVTAFQPGDEVYGDLSPCGDGAFAEYAVAPEKAIAPKPVNLSFVEAAAVPMAALTALQALRDVAKVQAGQSVLINGASGGVGTFAVQLAKVLGAEVTAVCSTTKVEMVRALGADHVIDYKKEDFTQGNKRYDAILAVNGYHPLSAYRRVLKPQGIYVMAGGSNRQIFDALLWGSFMSKGDQKMTNMMAHVNKKDLLYLNGLIEAGKVKPVIDRCYPLHETANAIRYLEEGHARGKIVITVVEK